MGLLQKVTRNNFHSMQKVADEFVENEALS